jgi:hypothetical protein
MKVLFFIDTHGNESMLRKILAKSKEADLIVCLGDFTTFESDMEAILKQLNAIGKPVLLLHGNHETLEGIMHASKNLQNIHFIHRNYYITSDLIFLGYGGGGFSTRDDEFTRLAEYFVKDKELLLKTRKFILLTHAPPYGTRIDDMGKAFGHVGNQSITEFIVKHQPLLAISGHIHETAGQEDKINKTRLINPGWDGVIIEL